MRENCVLGSKDAVSVAMTSTNIRQPADTVIIVAGAEVATIVGVAVVLGRRR